MRMSSPKTFRRYRIGKGCHGVRALPLASLHPCVSDAFDRTFSRELAEKKDSVFLAQRDTVSPVLNETCLGARTIHRRAG